MATIQEIEARRLARRNRHDEERAAQELADLEAIDALEETSGEPLHTMTANEFKPGSPVRIAFRAPTAVEYKRYLDTTGRALQANNADARRKAQEALADVCLMYPADDAKKAMLTAHPGLLISLAIEAAKVAELHREEEGKG